VPYFDALWELSADTGDVFFTDLTRSEVLHDVGSRLGVERHEHEAGSKTVEPVHGWRALKWNKQSASLLP
jgi:hypothetical protein